MPKHICKDCGSTKNQFINHGFGTAFVLLWIAVAVCYMVKAVALAGLFLLLAGSVTFLALFQWKRVCTECKSDDIIPIKTPMGQKLLAELS